MIDVVCGRMGPPYDVELIEREQNVISIMGINYT